MSDTQPAATAGADSEVVADLRWERLMDGQAWEDFCDTLKAAGRIVVRERPPTATPRTGWRASATSPA